MCIRDSTYSKPAVEEIESGFSIEKVTDEFFEQYKDLYIKLSEHFAVSYTHLRAHETVLDIVCRLLLEKKKNNKE